MALTDESNGNGMVMPVQPMGGSYGGNMGGLGFGGDWAWILLLLVLGGGWGGFGGFGMGGAMMGMGMMDGFGLYPWLNNSQNINDGFRDQMLNTSVNGIQNAITSGFGDVQTALCGGFAGVNQNVSQGFANTNLGMCQGFNGVNTAISGAQNAITQQMYTNQIADLERSFAAQTANTAAIYGVNSSLQNCCCETGQDLPMSSILLQRKIARTGRRLPTVSGTCSQPPRRRHRPYLTRCASRRSTRSKHRISNYRTV